MIPLLMFAMVPFHLLFLFLGYIACFYNFFLHQMFCTLWTFYLGFIFISWKWLYTCGSWN